MPIKKDYELDRIREDIQEILNKHKDGWHLCDEEDILDDIIRYIDGIRSIPVASVSSKPE